MHPQFSSKGHNINASVTVTDALTAVTAVPNRRRLLVNLLQWRSFVCERGRCMYSAKRNVCWSLRRRVIAAATAVALSLCASSAD